MSTLKEAQAKQRPMPVFVLLFAIVFLFSSVTSAGSGIWGAIQADHASVKAAAASNAVHKLLTTNRTSAAKNATKAAANSAAAEKRITYVEGLIKHGDTRGDKVLALVCATLQVVVAGSPTNQEVTKLIVPLIQKDCLSS